MTKLFAFRRKRGIRSHRRRGRWVGLCRPGGVPFTPYPPGIPRIYPSVGAADISPVRGDDRGAFKPSIGGPHRSPTVGTRKGYAASVAQQSC